MLGRPQVRVVLRFRPLNEEEVQKPQQQQGEESDVEETSWIKYDEDSVEIIENAPALIGGIRMPSNIPNNKNNQDYNDNNSTTPVTPTTTTTTISTTNTMMTHLDSDVEKNGMMDVLSHTTTALIRPHSRKTFTFDAVLADSTEQQETYEYIGVPVLDYVLKGYNSTILAYGQTGSGKTHSMLGPAGGKLNCFTSRSPYYESRGLIPRFAEALFNDLARFNPTERKWRVSASMFEIYMENIIDLFCTGPQATEYRIREDTLSKAVYVESLEQVECMNAMQLLELVRSGMQRRHTAATESNDTSSRSHCILSLFLEQRDLLSDGSITLSRLNFVDLAGSEKVFRTLAEGDRLREAQCINLSLALLGNVIHRLTDPKPGYVPFRDCKLTRVLQDSLGGNALTTLLCHASTAALNRDETITTLRFAQRAKRVRNRPRVNKPLIQQELGLAHASALDRIRELKQRGGMLNEVSESEQQHQQQLQSIIDSLMNEVTELKKELRTKEEELQHTSDKVEFYKHQCTLLREEHDEVCEEHKAREMKLIELCATIEQERNALLLDIEELKFNITSTNQSDWKPIAPVTPAGNSMTLQDSRKTESGTAAMTVMHPLQSIHTIFIPRIEKPQRENKTNEWHHHTDPAAPTEEEFRRSITRTPHRGETHTGEMDLRLDTLDQDINQLNDIRIVEINTTTKGMGTNPLHQEESASVQRVLQLERKLVNTSTMTDLAATDLQEQEELATAQRILQERELVNVNTMTDLAATDLQEQEELATAQHLQRTSHSPAYTTRKELVNVNTMTDLAATDLQAQEELATAQRILQERELVNVNTMTDLAATDLQAQEELATAQRILQERELVNVNTMTDLAATDLQAQEELATAQRILQERELVNVNTMTDLAATDLQAQEELATAQRILKERELVNVNTMTDLAATDLQEQEELATAQRILQERELVNVNTMTDLAATDLQAQEELATAQRILKERELVNVNTMTDLAATDLQAQEELATAQRILQERELVNVNTMTDLAATDLQEQEELATAQRILQERELVNVNTMTDLAATDLQEQEELATAQRILQERELVNVNTMTDLAATDLQAQEELATAQRILQERELVNVNTMTDLAATDLQAQEELATAQRILQERELVNVNTMTDLAATDLQAQEELATAQRILQERELVNVNTMTDLAATDLQAQEELATAQRILKERELVNVNTMTDLAATDLQAQEEPSHSPAYTKRRETGECKHND
ncbi:Kinesin motor domain [Trypanosoma melophagium]|uniref:Kinesin motor domain n=1 Tax=Trypanosoma melophagium TaxID=715481 RepID=UPI00351A3FB7|nr:Kinesin motor domain [Trypanosoma melophagium]